ncbi:MAG: exodeoxyribonuclease V subunit gamma [Burkholderiales bacterium]|nr:exodeoxyribonuclease V subunit gamma [Burkholderiales bacterium]
MLKLFNIVQPHAALFGAAFLPPLLLEFFLALATRLPLRFYQPNPCLDYWGDIVSGRERARRQGLWNAHRRREGLEYAEAGHPLLASWGALGREYLRAIHAPDSVVHDDDAFVLPDSSHLLGWLQKGILLLDPRHETPPREHLPSIELHGCPDRRREVEVLHDRLLAMFEQRPELKPHDIVVMSPQIDAYVPYIDAVFGGAARELALPYRISDVPLRRAHPLVDAFLRVLALDDSRFTRTDVAGLLAEPAIARRFGIDADGLAWIATWLEQAAVRWGLDAPFRAAVGSAPLDENSWRFGFDRLLLGHALGDASALVAGVAPVTNVEGGDARVLGDGGSVILWSNQATRAYGRFSARGGLFGGHGGLVETSGGWLDARPAALDVSAPVGRAGTWLLDPNNILVSDAVTDSNISAGPMFFTTNDNSTISTATIAAALNAGNSVSILTAANGENSQDGDITIDGMNLVVAPPTPVTLTFDAHRHVGMGNSVVRSNGAALGLNLLSARGDSGGIAVVSTTVNTAGGDVRLGSAVSRQLEWEGSLTPTAYHAALGDLTTAPFASGPRIGIFFQNSQFDLGAGSFSAYGGTAASVGGRGTGILVGQAGNGTGHRITAANIEMVGATGTGTLPPVPALPEMAVALNAGTHLTATDKLHLFGFGGRGVRTVNAKLTLNASSPNASLLINGQSHPSFDFGTAGMTMLAGYTDAPMLVATGGTVEIIGNRSAFITGSAVTDHLMDVSGASLFRIEGTNRGVSLGPGTLDGPDNGLFDVLAPLTPGVGFFQAFNGVRIFTGGALRVRGDRLLFSEVQIESTQTPLNIELASVGSRLILDRSQLNTGGGSLRLTAAGGPGELPGNYGDHAFGIYLRDSQLTAFNGAVEINGVAPNPDSPALAGPTLALTGVGVVNSDIQGGTLSLTGLGRTGDGHNGIGVALYEGSTLNGTNIQLTGTGANDIGVRLANNAGSVSATQNLTITGRETFGTSATIEVDGTWRLTAGDTMFLDGTGNSVDLTDSFGPNGPRFVAGKLFHLKFTERQGPVSVVDANTLDWLNTLFSEMPANAVTRLTGDGANIVFSGVLNVPSRLHLAFDNLSLAAGGGLRSSASGDAVVLTGFDGFGPLTQFGNNAGATGIQTPDGRWLLHATGPAQVQLGGLSPAFTVYDAATAGWALDAQGNWLTPSTGSGVAYDQTFRAATGAGALLGSAAKTYDGTSSFGAQNGLSFTGLLPGYNLQLTGGLQSADKNAGQNKPLSLAQGALLQMTDAAGMPVFGFEAPTLTGSIAQALLRYEATATVRPEGSSLLGLEGGVSGFVGGDTLASATSGALQWTTPATPASLPGSYAIEGSGLSAVNYRFEQAAGNATALTLTAAPRNNPVQQNTLTLLDLGLASVVPPVQMSTPSEGRVLDAVPSLGGSGDSPSFRPVNASTMSRSELVTLLAARDNFKKKLFADTLHKLEIDPSLANVRPCANEHELGTGLCLITAELKRSIEAARRLEQLQRTGAARVKQAKLPAIERKVALLIGINEYSDRRIPALLNAVPDARAVRKLLEEQLGYETVIVEDASKETIIRALNRVALDAGRNDSVMIYYAGHGEVVPKTGLGYWLPADSRVDKPETWLANADIERMISLIGAKQLMLVSDSCYSGTLAGSEKVKLDGSLQVDELLNRKAAIVMSSGGNEPVADEGREGHSIFAWHLMSKLRELGDWQAGGNVFERIRTAVSAEFPQTPQYGASRSAGHQTGTDYLFERREIEKAAGPAPANPPAPVAR